MKFFDIIAWKEEQTGATQRYRACIARMRVHTSRLRGMLTATYVWRMRSMSYVSTAYLPRYIRMYHVCVTYVRRIGPATYSGVMAKNPLLHSSR